MIDGLDAGFESILRAAQLYLLALQEDVATRRAHYPRQDFQQRRLARAVVADEPQHFARA
jgi:hypothetical protein